MSKKTRDPFEDRPPVHRMSDRLDETRTDDVVGNGFSADLDDLEPQPLPVAEAGRGFSADLDDLEPQPLPVAETTIERPGPDGVTFVGFGTVVDREQPNGTALQECTISVSDESHDPVGAAVAATAAPIEQPDADEYLTITMTNVDDGLEVVDG